MPGCGVECVKNIINTLFFCEVSLFHVFIELDDIQSTLGCLFGSFGSTWNSLFLIFEGPRSRSGIRRFSRDTLEGPRLRQHSQVRVKTRSVGPLPANHRLQACYSIEADTRTRRLTVADRKNTKIPGLVD